LYLTCCKILGINPGADIETIKAAYRKSAKELHPDLNPSDKAQYYFIILQNAYEYLLDHPEIPERLREGYSSSPKFQNIKTPGYPSGNIKQRYLIRQYTMREVLKNSLTARILYIFFHIFFLFIGFLLIFRSLYDLFSFGVDKGTNIFTAYLSIFAAIMLGIMITGIFLMTGFSYLKYR
jgi:curved DNA-binding protein CbpA